MEKGCSLIGVIDHTGTLNEGEVFVQICRNARVENNPRVKQNLELI